MKLDPQLSEVIERTAEREGVELVHAEMVGSRSSMLQIYIDKPNGITIENCASFSERLSLILDVEDIIPHKYTLEVASPGLDRGLYKESDYERFAGRICRVRTSDAVAGRRNFKGKLLGIGTDDDSQKVVRLLDETGTELLIPFEIILKANLEIEP